MYGVIVTQILKLFQQRCSTMVLKDASTPLMFCPKATLNDENIKRHHAVLRSVDGNAQCFCSDRVDVEINTGLLGVAALCVISNHVSRPSILAIVIQVSSTPLAKSVDVSFAVQFTRPEGCRLFPHQCKRSNTSRRAPPHIIQYGFGKQWLTPW